MKKFFAYRIIETTYRNYIVYDEGPGSATSVDAATSKRILHEWRSAPESLAAEIRTEGYSFLHMQSSSPDGRYDYSYTLERAEVGTTQWKYHGHVPRYQHIDCQYCGDLLSSPGANCPRCDDYH